MQKIKFIGKAALALLLLHAGQLRAQRNVTDGYFNRLLPVTWADDRHYIAFIEREGTEVRMIVDAATGEQRPAGRAAPARPAVSITRKGDIKFADKTVISGIKAPCFSPDSSKVAFVRGNNLVVLDLPTKQEWQVTADGGKDVYNGYASWVYNEEILGRGMNYRAFWWSPDGRHIAFFRSDESGVPVHYIFNDEGQHGTVTALHYPKAGDKNPEVKVGIAGIDGRTVTWADYDPETDQYFGAPYWRPDGKALWVQWMNRRQDTLKVEEIALSTGRKRNIYAEHQSTWISLDAEDRITFLSAKKQFLLMSDKSGWMHLYLHDMNGRELRPLTSGQWSVDKVQYTDEKEGVVYFTARKENSTRLDLYRVNLNGSGFQRLTAGPYNHRVTLSPGGSYFIDHYSNLSTPAKQALVNNKGKMLKELGDERGKNFEAYRGPKYELVYVKTDDGFDLPVRITWPAGMDTATQYPVMVNIYGGPGRMNVTDGFIGAYTSPGKKPIIQITMDHRGSGHFGKAGENYLYGNLGKWEIADYSHIMKTLIKKYPVIDPARIGITGFSYGGYLTCLAVTKGSDVFSYGLAGGSVTDWMLYDTHYTERYMGLPSANPEGYKAAAVMPYVKQYKGMLRMAQGTVDDNVHMQHTMQLVNALQQAGKRFELMFYPGAAHGWFFMHEKQAHFLRENQQFIDTYLFGKEVPAIQNTITKTQP